MTTALTTTNLSKTYGEGHTAVNAVSNATFALEENEFVALVGPSGSGKSTLMNMLAGLEFPDTGTACFRGSEIKEPGQERGLVFQSYSLMPWLSVHSNVALAADAVHRKMPRAEKDALINKYDIHFTVTEEIEAFLEEKSIPLLGKIPFDKRMVEAMIEGKSNVEFDHKQEISTIIKSAWKKLEGFK